MCRVFNGHNKSNMGVIANKEYEDCTYYTDLITKMMLLN